MNIPKYLFFYGTLVAGNPNPVATAIHEQLEPFCTAKVEGTLHAIPDAAGWFPALLPGEAIVHGQLYATKPGFDAALLAKMDAYEDFDPADSAKSLYRRALVRAHTDDLAFPAQAYLWNRSLPEGAALIPGGDFGQWLAQTGKTAFGATRSA